MPEQPDFYVDPYGNVRDARKFNHPNDSTPPAPPHSPVAYVDKTPPQKRQDSAGVIFIPIGLILTLFYYLLRGCGSYETNLSNSEPVIPFYNLAESYYAQGDYQAALSKFNSAINIDPGFSEAYNGRGLVYDALGEYEQAINDFNQAIELMPVSPTPYNNRGCVFIRLGKYDQAIADFDQAIHIQPELAKAYFNRGLVYEILYDDQAAIENFTNAILYTTEGSLSPLDSQMLELPSSDYIDQEDRSLEARETVMELESFRVDLQDAYFHRGLAYFNQADLTNSQLDLRKALELGLEPADQELAESLLLVIDSYLSLPASELPEV